MKELCTVCFRMAVVVPVLVSALSALLVPPRHTQRRPPKHAKRQQALTNAER